ncbi:MAG: 50S ribosomal protein L40e [Candidatus Woesearchaeota archaeon]
MVKFPEADARMFRNKFVCRNCKSVVSAPNRKIAEGAVKCRKCQGKDFKPKRKK